MKKDNIIRCRLRRPRPYYHIMKKMIAHHSSQRRRRPSTIRTATVGRIFSSLLSFAVVSFLIVSSSSSAVITTAFCCSGSSISSSGTSFTTTNKQQQQQQQQRHRQPFLLKQSSSSSSSNENENNNDDSADSSAAATTDLTSSLAKLDKAWHLIKKDSQEQRRWTELYIVDDDTDEEDENDTITTTTSASDDNDDEQQPSGKNNDNKKKKELVYVLEPPSYTTPSCTIVFIGGAGLGQYPHISYNEFLTRVSNRLNAAVIAVPYTVLTLDLDHFEWSKRAGELARKALHKCRTSNDPNFANIAAAGPDSPTYCLAHSLGCKLATIYSAAVSSHDYDGMGFISFNNFGFGKTLSMAKDFAETIGTAAMDNNNQEGGDSTSSSSSSSSSAWDAAASAAGIGGSNDKTRDILDQVFSFAETAVNMIGIDFTPNSADTERIINMKYDAEKQRKTRLFTFDDDTLENTQDFINACDGPGPDVSGLPGTHLTPVFFKLALDQLPEEARELAAENLGGFVSASFGNEDELEALVDEVTNWILGKGPSRPPKWLQDMPKLAGDETGTPLISGSGGSPES